MWIINDIWYNEYEVQVQESAKEEKIYNHKLLVKNLIKKIKNKIRYIKFENKHKKYIAWLKDYANSPDNVETC